MTGAAAESDRFAYRGGRFTARPGEPSEPPLGAGVHEAPAEAGWAGVLLVPESYAPGVAVPFMMALHGATGTGERMLNRWREIAERRGLITLAPSSEHRTWDVLMGGFGPDVARLDRALAWVFARYTVDPTRLLIEGFSDGASYALSLGIANGNLFTHLLGNSPGFCWPPCTNGLPRILLTHGTQDAVLPINATSRMLAPQLAMNGYDVTYHEFDGPHTLTPEIMALSLDWAGVPEPEAGAASTQL